MKPYIDYILIGMKEHLAYPGAVWAKFFSRIIYLYLQFSIWKALFASNSQINMSLNQNDTLKYVAVATIISTFIECNTIDWLNAQIQTGNIALDLIRPVNFKGMLFFRQLGDTIVKIMFYCIPLSVVVVIIMGNQFLCPFQFFYGILSVIFAYGIQLLYSLIIGLLAFWLIVTWPLNMLLGAIYKLLSGVWIPVTMFPDFLYRINLFLPFRAIYAIPVTLLTQKMEVYDITVALLTQLLWIGILYLITEIVWFEGNRKLIVQGG